MEPIRITGYRSPVGGMILGSYKDKLCICDWAVEKRRATIDRRICRYLNTVYKEGSSEVIDRATAQLDEYFAGERTEFTIPVIFTGTDFQCRVWSALMRIPYGETIPYGQLANRIGSAD